MKRTRTVLGKKGQHGRPPKHEVAFKQMIASRYNRGDESLNQIAREFNISKVYVSRWAKEFSSELAEEQIVIPMTEQEQKDYELLKKQNEALKKKLEYSEMKNFALETLVDLAKSELGIDLRKNSGAKQPKE